MYIILYFDVYSKLKCRGTMLKEKCFNYIYKINSISLSLSLKVKIFLRSDIFYIFTFYVLIENNYFIQEYCFDGIYFIQEHCLKMACLVIFQKFFPLGALISRLYAMEKIIFFSKFQVKFIGTEFYNSKLRYKKRHGIKNLKGEKNCHICRHFDINIFVLRCFTENLS